MPRDDRHAVLARNGKPGFDLVRIDVPESDDLIVRAGKLRDAVVMRRKDRDRVRAVQVPRHRLHDHRALIRVRAARELVEQEQGIAFFDLPERFVEPHDLRAEAAQTRLHRLRVVKQHADAAEQRQSCALCADQKARRKQQHVQRDGLHRNALAAHVRAGDDRRPAIGRDRNGYERASLCFQKIDKLRVHHVGKLQRGFRDLGTHTAVTHGEQRFLDQKVELTRGVGVCQHGGDMGEKRSAHRRADRAFLGLLLGAYAGAHGSDRVLFRLRRFIQPLLEPLLFGADRAQRFRSAVRNIESAGTRALGIEHVQRGCRIGEREPLDADGLVHPVEQRTKIRDAQQKALELKQLHVIEARALRKPFQRAADILELTEHKHDLIVDGLQRVRRVCRAFRVPKLRFQFVPLVRRVEAQLAHTFRAEGTAGVQRVENVSQSDLFPVFKTDRDQSGSSFTLMTGTSTAAAIVFKNASGSNFQP